MNTETKPRVFKKPRKNAKQIPKTSDRVTVVFCVMVNGELQKRTETIKEKNIDMIRARSIVEFTHRPHKVLRCYYN